MPEAELDRFLAALRRLESGSFEGNYRAVGVDTGKGNRALGAYQIMRSNWDGWAKEAGIPGADWRDPRAQDRVARLKVLQYYRRFGSWDLVAVAWFAGPGRAEAAMRKGLGVVGGLADANRTTVSHYVRLIRNYMANAPENYGPVSPPALDEYAQPQPYQPAPFMPSWMQEMGGAVDPEAQKDAARKELEANLRDVLQTISVGIAGGEPRLPSLHQPQIVGGIEPPGQEEDLGDRN